MTPQESFEAMSPWLERAWLVNYLDGHLSEEEAEWFEAYALDKPDLMATIDADTRLRRSLEGYFLSESNPVNTSADTGGSTGSIAANEVPASPSTMSSRRATPAWIAIAAALIVGLGVGWVVPRTGLVLKEGSESTVLANPTHVVYDTVRGTPVPPRIEQGDSATPFVLVEVAVPPGAEQVELHLDSGAGTPLSPAADGLVRFLLSKEQLGKTSEGQIRYTIDGQRLSRPISFVELKRGNGNAH